MASSHVIDAHCHLLDESFDSDRGAVIERAKAEGVIAIVEGAQNLEESKNALSSSNSFWRPAAGVHPLFVDQEDLDSMLEFIRLNASSLVAVGETGLDYYYGRTIDERERMKASFRHHAELAQDLNLPVVVHSRSAGREAVSLLIAWGIERALLHAFDGKPSVASEGVRAGYYFSIPPSVVRSQQKRKLVRAIPLESLMVETDSPVLGPTGKERNEPRNVWVPARVIAEEKRVQVEEVANITTSNATGFFRLKLP